MQSPLPVANIAAYRFAVLEGLKAGSGSEPSSGQGKKRR